MDFEDLVTEIALGLTASSATPQPTPVLYLDVDGTVRHGLKELGRFVNGPEDVVVFPQAVERMEAWRRAGGRIIGVSNQGGVALGHVRGVDVAEAMLETQWQCGGQFDCIAVCTHHPDAPSPGMARCWCRKPRPGLAIEAALSLARRHKENYPPWMSLVVGDRPEDEGMAAALNVDFLSAAAWRNGD